VDSDFNVHPRYTEWTPFRPCRSTDSETESVFSTPRSPFLDRKLARLSALSLQAVAQPLLPNISRATSPTVPCEPQCAHPTHELELLADEKPRSPLSTPQPEAELLADDKPHSPPSTPQLEVHSPTTASPPLKVPIHSLPSTVLSVIFAHCLAGTDLFIEPDVDSAPLSLGQVCREWRTIAISAPSLWTSLLICGSDAQIGRLLPAIQLWLARSGTLPLSIGICVFQARELTYPSLDKIIAELVPHSHRWERLHLRIPAAYLERLLDRPAVPFPSLRSLRLDPTTSVDEMGTWSFRISPGATALRHLSINGHTVQFSPCRITAPWSQLTALSSTAHMTIDDCFEIFRLCANLHTCSLLSVHTSFRRLNFCQPRAPIVVPDLSALCVHCTGDSFHGLAALLNALQLTGLRTLEIAGPPLDFWPQSQFRGFLARSSPPLTRVAFSNIPMSEDNLLENIRMLPELTALEASLRDRDLRTDDVKDELERRSRERTERTEDVCGPDGLETVVVMPE
jgi:hypothetical protein